jgi:hypothetical protein
MHAQSIWLKNTLLLPSESNIVVLRGMVDEKTV